LSSAAVVSRPYNWRGFAWMMTTTTGEKKDTRAWHHQLVFFIFFQFIPKGKEVR
jgi:hypothetical protein